ncbi:Carbohydrate-binding protein [Phytophthora megakarya]|uniref:Carbohydrate-binding protein n=1 Tax=Phytophthora megakarya TaxID=4795 RepID=A0A225WDG7_9STRA|nr:Carbohydrate-binding protein [Phytophthora megakarya]
MKTFVFAAALAVVCADEYFTGDGTAYTLGQSSAGNCNMMSALDFAITDYAALNNEQWDGLQNCGRCAEVSCADSRCADQSKSIVVQILDRCPECEQGDLDLSPTVFTALTGSTPSRYTIKWKFVDCPVSGNVNYCLKGGSNNYWTAVQPTNFATGVKSLQINGQDTTMLDSAYYYLLDGASQTQTDLSSVTISMTDVNGNSIEDTVSLTADSCTEGANQLPSSGSSQTSQQSTPATKSPTPTTSAPTTAPLTQAPTPTPTPKSTKTPAPTTQTPSPTTVRPATTAPATTVPTQQEILPTSVPVSTTAPLSTTAPPTSAPVPTFPESSISQDSEPSSGSDANPFDQQDFNVTGTIEPSTSKTSKSSGKTTSTSSGNSDDDYTHQDQTLQQTETTPSTNTEQTADSQAGDDAQSVTTKSSDSSGDTDPWIIILSTLGAVGMVALIVVVVIAKRKNIAEQKARDVELPSMMSVQSFDMQNTPSDRRQAFGML